MNERDEKTILKLNRLHVPEKIQKKEKNILKNTDGDNYGVWKIF